MSLGDRLRLEGKLVGVAEGERLGIAKGEQVGIAKGERIGRSEVAINMIRSGMDNDLIGRITALPAAEIEQLRKIHND